MSGPRLAPLAVLALVVAALLAGCGAATGGAGSAARHRTMTLILGTTKVFQTDVGRSGSSRGDVRTFTRPVLTTAGRRIGRMDGTTAITDEVRRGGGVREYRVGTVHYTLRRGTIAIAGVYVARPNSAVPAPGGDRRPIVGGTGAYRDAQGEVRQTALSHGREKDVLLLDLPAR